MFQKILSLCLAVILLAASIPAMAEEDAHRAFAEQFMNDLMGGQKNEELYGMFTDEVKAQFPREAFDAAWSQTVAACGNFKGFGSFAFQKVQGYDLYLLRLNMEKTDLMMQLTLDASGKVAGFFFTNPPEESAEPAKENLPAGIVEESVTVGEGEWALPGTLTLPESGANFPAVVLVQGSGAHDRDEAIGGTKLFQDLAWTLAQNGIAVLRYDKRTYAHANLFTQDILKNLTVKEETVDDAVLAGRLLKSDERIDSKNIFLIGHSLGAMLGPRTAAEDKDLFAGMVLVSGSPLLLTDIVIAQNEDVLSKMPEDMRAAQQPLLDAEIEKLNALYAMTPEEAKQVTVFGLYGYYFYEMRAYDAASLLLGLKLPTLILQGGKDFQVSVEDGLNAWKKALGEQEYVTYKLYPELNHMMMRYTGDPKLQFTVQEYDTPANIDETAAADIIQWLKDNIHLPL